MGEIFIYLDYSDKQAVIHSEFCGQFRGRFSMLQRTKKELKTGKWLAGYYKDDLPMLATRYCELRFRKCGRCNGGF